MNTINSYTRPLKFKKTVYIVPKNPMQWRPLIDDDGGHWYSDGGFVMKRNKCLHARDIKRLGDMIIQTMQEMPGNIEGALKKITSEKAIFPHSQIDIYDITNKYKGSYIRIEDAKNSYFYNKKYVDIILSQHKRVEFDLISMDDVFLLRAKDGDHNAVGFVMPLYIENKTEKEFIEEYTNDPWDNI